MTMKSWLSIASLTLALASPAFADEVAMPSGVKVQDSVAGNIFANADGLTLYTAAIDNKPGQLACSHNTEAGLFDYDCLVEYHPFVAPDGAAPVGDWSIVTRSDDNTKQWAYRGRLVYTYKFDTHPGSVNAEVGSGETGTRMRPQQAGHRLEWSALRISKTMAPGLRTQATPYGEVLANAKGMTLYAMSDDKAVCDGSCLESWKPLTAGTIAHSIDDYPLVARADGTKQWTYKGKPLYSFAGDRVTGDVKGQGRDNGKWQAVVTRPDEPPPAGVTVASTVQGSIYADSLGKTLYGYLGLMPSKDMSAVSHECLDKCDQVWHPAPVPENARLTGSWSAVTLPNGTRQLAYKGLPLYTYYADKQPGDMLGNQYGQYPTEWFTAIQPGTGAYN